MFGCRPDVKPNPAGLGVVEQSTDTSQGLQDLRLDVATNEARRYERGVARTPGKSAAARARASRPSAEI